jgi:nucleotide-binding universal stress UspA family protein
MMAEICPTTGVERVLLSMDGSEYSEGAVREAIKLAKKCSSFLSILSVVDYNPEFDAVAPQLTEKRDQDARRHLEAAAAAARREGVECETVIQRGEDAYQSIVNEAVKRKSTMIVMGRRGRTGLKRLVMGSVTARVIGHAPCNVLVVPKAADLGFKSIVVATDGSPYSLAAAAHAVGLAKRNEGLLTVIAVVPAEIAAPTDIDFTVNQRELIAEKEMQHAERNAKAVKEAAEKEGVSAKAYVMSGKPADSIIQAAGERRADLIVLGSHGRTGVERLLMGSVAERVIVLASCPVLVVRAERIQ